MRSKSSPASETGGSKLGDVGRGAMPGGVANSNLSTLAEVIRNRSLNPDVCRNAGLAAAEGVVPVVKVGEAYKSKLPLDIADKSASFDLVGVLMACC